MEWVILFGILLCVLLVIYGRLREELASKKQEQINALKKQIEEQHRMARKKDAEYLGNASATDVVGFLNRLHQDDTSTD